MPETKPDDPKAETLYGIILKALRDTAAPENVGLALDELCAIAMSAPGQACAIDPQELIETVREYVSKSPTIYEGGAKGFICQAEKDHILIALSKLESILTEKTVPLALVERLRYQGIHTREQIVKMFADYGYTVK
jgi:hypothetical protein